MTSGAQTWFDLTIDGRPNDMFAVVGFSGEEAISALYRFDVTLCADGPDIDADRLIGQTARLRFSTFGQTRVVHGVIAEAAYVEEQEGAGSIYCVALVPRLWRLMQTCQNRVLGAAESRSVADLLEDDLKAAGLLDDEAATAAEAGSGADYGLDLRGSFWQRRHTVQYGETDLAFLSRHLEAQGIFYLFDERNDKDVAVFADHGEAFPDVADAASLSYRPADGMVHDAPSLRRFEATARPVPQKVVLKDYNYRLPHVTMQAEAVVDPDGVGTVVRYGDHFRTPEEGAALARVKADAFACRRLLVEGSSDCVGLAAGRRFRLHDHPSRLYDGRRFLVERVVHEGWDPRFGVAPSDGTVPVGDAPGYTNRFEGLDATRAYRPEERTPRPVMNGVTHARIDAAGDGRRAELDDQGRYAVRLGFDLSGAADGAASRPMRMMQPYGGSSQGMHFPLLKGTEVLLSSVDGHPDRPLILGAVPNPAQPSPVTNATATRNRLRTTSDILLELEDGAASADDETGTARLAQQQGVGGDDDDDALTSSTTWAKLSLTDYGGDSGTDAYLRLGSADSDSESDYVADISAAAGDDWSADGMLAFVSGTATRVTEGDRADSIGGDSVRVVDGDETDSIAGSRTTSVGYGDSGDDTRSVAGDRNLVLAGDLSTTVSGDWTVSVDGDSTISVGPDADVISHAVGGDLDITVDGKYTMSASGKFSRKLYGDAATTHGSAVGMLDFSHYITHTGATFQLYGDIEVELYPEGLGHTSVSLDIQGIFGLGAQIYLLKVVTGTYKDFIGEKVERGVFKASENALKMKYANISYAEDSLLVKAYTAIFKG